MWRKNAEENVETGKWRINEEWHHIFAFLIFLSCIVVVEFILLGY